DLPRWPNGDLHYSFHIVDIKGNWNSSIERSVVLLNRVPDISYSPDWEVTEGKLEVLDLESYLMDANDDVSDLTLSTDAEGITVDRLRLNALYHEWKAPHTILVNVTDGEDTTMFSIDLTVIDVNDLPEITSTPPPEGAVGQEYSYLVEFTDEDIGDTHTLGLFRIPAGMVVAGMTITWTPGMGQEGTHTVELGLNDGTSIVGQTWVITVTAPVNQPPAFTNAPVLTHTAGDHYEWDAEAEDPEGDDLTFTLVSGPEGAQMDASTGVLTWDPLADERDRTENVAFVVRVSDDELQTNLPFTVVLTSPANQAPEVGPGLGEQKVNKDTRIDLTSYMSDPDDPNEDLHWTAETDSDLFTVRIDGNVLVIDPEDDKKGQGKVILGLYDPYGLVDTQELTVTVDTKEDVERDWCDSLWWIAIILLVLAAHILYMTQDRWRPKKEAAPMEEPDPEPTMQEGTGEEK
ncbi:MAG: Ig domain-containing protein, partial [Candidatus Thermoplasmatota archaeon]|nr:Ig domain-containing protein [Candidatus Thermoplasmatota archaeon]